MFALKALYPATVLSQTREASQRRVSTMRVWNPKLVRGRAVGKQIVAMLCTPLPRGTGAGLCAKALFVSEFHGTRRSNKGAACRSPLPDTDLWPHSPSLYAAPKGRKLQCTTHLTGAVVTAERAGLGLDVESRAL